MNTNSNFRMTRYEREFETASKVMDIELFALELEYNEELGKAIREAVRRKSDERQAELDKLIESHPKTIAERERWNKNWDEYRQRMARLKKQDEVIPAERAARQLARRWGLPVPEVRQAHAKLVG